MKKKSLIFVVVALIGVVWFVMASKFEKMMTENYLPMLEAQKEQGVISFDTNNIEIEKYKFKVAVKDLVLFPSNNKQIKFDQVSSCYNPLTNQIKIYNDKKISFGLDEVHAIDPSVTVKLPFAAIKGDMDNFAISLNTKNLEFLKTADNSVILSLDPIALNLSAKIDEKEDTYEWKLDLATSDSSTNHLEHFKTFLNLLSPADQESVKKAGLMNVLENLDAVVLVIGPVNYKIGYSSTGSTEHAKDLKRLIQNQITIEEFFADFKQASFDTKLNIEYGNDKNNSTLKANIYSNEKELKFDVGAAGKSHYSEKDFNALIDIMAKYYAQEINQFLAETNGDKAKTLTEEDLKPLSERLVNIHDAYFDSSFVLSKENTDFSGRLEIGVDNYKLDLVAEGKDNKSYGGKLKLSDPAKLIQAKALFIREVILPLLEKMDIVDTAQLTQVSKINDNTEANGFEALKALSRDPNFKDGENFEADIVFDPNKFEFKVNDKSFLHIMTDERVTKFLKGFDEEGK